MNTEATSVVFEGDYDKWILTDEFFELLIDYVNFMNTNNCLDKQVKDNLLRLINYIRFKTNKLSETQDLILKINSGRGENAYVYYCTLLDGHNINYKKVDDIKDLTSYFVAYDLLVLYSHLKGDDFELYIDNFINSIDYFSTIHYFAIYESELFKTEPFNENFLKVLMVNEKIVKYSKDKVFKKIVKTYSKMISD